MITEYPGFKFWWLSHQLVRLEYKLREGEALRIVSARAVNFPVALTAEIDSIIRVAEEQCRTFRFQDTALLPLYNIRAVLEKLRVMKEDFPDPRPDLARDLAALRKTIQLELARRRFVYISPEGTDYFRQEKLFGNQVYEKFIDARQDITSAGDCLAIGLPNACVFHLMRVAEYGLRTLARKLRVNLKHKGKSCPIEFADWNTVITACKNNLAQAHQLSKSKKRKDKLERYADAADHCMFMKDVWRNNVAHTNTGYVESEALGVLERVRDFMNFLAKHL